VVAAGRNGVACLPRALEEMSIHDSDLGRSVESFSAFRATFINGQWADAASGKTFETPNPRPGRPRRVAEGEAEDIDRAVRCCAGRLTRAVEQDDPVRAGRIIWRIGDLILDHLDELAQLESLDNGKPSPVARAPIDAGGGHVHYMAGGPPRSRATRSTSRCPTCPAPTPLLHAARAGRRVGQIIPWNFPLLMAAWKLAPALATGNLRGAQASRADPADRAAARRAHGRGWPAGRRMNVYPASARPPAQPWPRMTTSTRSPSPAPPT